MSPTLCNLTPKEPHCGDCASWCSNIEISENPDYGRCNRTGNVHGRNVEICRDFWARSAEPPCFFVLVSDVNGYEYCRHPDTKSLGYNPYCRPDSRTNAFVCPLGKPGKDYGPLGISAEDDMEHEIEQGRQATLEGF